MNLDEVKVYSAYKGRQGCMCGCLGKYYKPESKMASKILQTIKDNFQQAEIDDDFLFLELDGKYFAVYTNPSYSEM